MDILKINIVIADTTTSRTSKDLSNEVHFIKSIKNQIHEKTTSEPPVVSPSQIIFVSNCDENSSIYLLFHEDKGIVEE